MPASRDVTVRIFGRDYTLRSDVEPEVLLELAGEVDVRMREAAEAARSAGASVGLDRLAVLVALNLAEELARLRHAADARGRGENARLERLLAVLSNEVGNEGSVGVS